MGSDDVQLLSGWLSPFSMRAEVALLVKGVSYTNSPQDVFNKSPLLLQSNPVYKKIPVLIHHGKAVCESLLIVQYVDEAFPSPDGKDLLPKDPYDRATARFWADFVDKKIFDVLVGMMRKTGDEQKAATEELKQNLKTLDSAFVPVPKEQPYFGGANMGYVDVILAPLVAWYEAFEVNYNMKFEFEKLPRLSAWMKAMQGNPCAQKLAAPGKVTEAFKGIFEKAQAGVAAQAQAQGQA